MAEYIGCRNCSSPSCKGCNIYTLATMLENGKFDCLMNGNRSVNPWADVAPVVHGKWKAEGLDNCYCSRCVKTYIGFFASSWNYCPNCGAKMDGE